MDVVDVRHTYMQVDQKRVPRKDALELQEVVKYSARILGTKLFLWKSRRYSNTMCSPGWPSIPDILASASSAHPTPNIYFG